MARLTLAGRAEAGTEVRHSRFRAVALPVDTPEAALAFFVDASDPAATHNCWAYRIDDQYRFHDDGEVGGTAGRPILAAIDGSGLDRIAVLVTRWYGGVKLGAGGLVRAYGGCAAECLRLAPTAELVDYADARVRYGFEDTGAVHGALGMFDAERMDERFTPTGAELDLRVPRLRLPDLKAHLRDATRDRVRLLDTSDDA